MDDLVDESATPIERNILRYGQHIGNLASYIFRAFFLEGKQNETVGTEFYDELLTYFPYLKEMLGFLEGINPANLDYLNVDDGKKEELVKSMKANLNSVKGCLGDVENPQNRDRLVNEVRGQSQIRQLMASMDVSFGLARKVMALLPSDATILGS